MISSLKYIEIPASSRNHFRNFETIFAAVLPPAGGLREGRNNTIKDRLKALKRARHIQQHGAGPGTWYGLA